MRSPMNQQKLEGSSPTTPGWGPAVLTGARSLGWQRHWRLPRLPGSDQSHVAGTWAPGGFRFVMGYPLASVVMDDHDLVLKHLKPMVTWGTPIAWETSIELRIYGSSFPQILIHSRLGLSWSVQHWGKPGKKDASWMKDVEDTKCGHENTGTRQNGGIIPSSG